MLRYFEETQLAGLDREALKELKKMKLTSRFLAWNHWVEPHETANILPFGICRNSKFV